MKTYTKVNFIGMLALLWLGSFGLFGQVAQEPDWKWQNPLLTGDPLQGLHFINDQYGWAVGHHGTILKTTNGGRKWIFQSVGTNDGFSDIIFTDFQNGWIVGSGGSILKTTDGGSKWIKNEVGTVNDLTSIHFVNAQTGWTVGRSGTILKTSNGGNSWNSQNSGTSQYLTSVHFVDLENGWAVGSYGTILKTSNGGETWQSQISGTNKTIYSVQFIDTQNGWAVGGESSFDYYKTINGGQTWERQSSGYQNYLLSVYFINSQCGWAVGGPGKIFKTVDGGNSWQPQINESSDWITDIQFTDVLNGWAVGSTGSILRTTNGGHTWINHRWGKTNQLNYIRFIDSQTGWAVGNGGIILKTSNGGNNWQSQSTGTLLPVNSIYFLDKQKCWAVAGNRILKTINGGDNWQSQISGSPQRLTCIYFTDAQNGYILGYGGTILKTINGGETWQSQNSGTAQVLRSMHFINSQTGIIVGWGGAILKTTNGGINWVDKNNTGHLNSFNSVNFVDAQNGWAAGEVRLKTTNGGDSWQINGYGPSIETIHFTDILNGWAAGYNGTILKTTNGGQSWESQKKITYSMLNSMYFTDPLHGWAVGENGTILTTSTNTAISPETPTTLLTGTLSEKTAANCNPSNIPVPNRLIKAKPGPYYGISDNQGKYNLRLPLSNTATPFTLQALGNQNPAFNVEVVCPPFNQYNITLDTIPDTLSNKDFGFEITPCHHLDVQIASNRRRRCFQNTTSISYQNQGSLSAPDAHLLVEFPHWVRPVSASRNYVAINDSVWRFNLDTVKAGFGGSFIITDSVLCGNVGILGLSQCTKATIFPAPDCPPPPGYSGAEVTVSGKCVNGFVSLGIYNKGNTDMADSVDYWVYLDSIQVKQAKVKLLAGDSLKLWVESLGLSVHLTANQVQNHPTELFVSTTVESCGDTFIFIPRQTVNRFAKQQTPNTKTHCLPVLGAYDPNDKQAFPIGFTNQNIIPPNTQLEYLVRFQNTGNDTAFTVYIIDTLDTNLNPETIELGATSHNYQLSMQTVKSGKTFLRWQFNNIMLPDSNSNQLKSNGFIQYRISPKANLALGSKVRNQAEIYFDFNPPIITNQTLTTYNVITFKDSALNDNVQIVTAAKGKLSPKQIGVNLYPNPVTEHSLTADFQTKGSLTLFNAQGQQVYEKQNIEGKQELPIQLRTGFYMAQLRTERGVSVVKVVVE